MKGNLFVISGPSGAGKGTICGEFMKKHPDTWLSVSATTRRPRPGEVDGKNYFFITPEEFRTRIAKGDFLEHAVYCDNYYGTPKSKVMEQLEQGRNVILEIECNGAMQVRSHYPEGVFIFVSPPSLDVLKSRLIGRGTEEPQVITKRFEKAREEYKTAAKYNYLLINDDLADAVARLEAIVEAEKSYMPRNIEFVEKEFLK